MVAHAVVVDQCPHLLCPALMSLTFLTVAVSRVNLGELNTPSSQSSPRSYGWQ